MTLLSMVVLAAPGNASPPAGHVPPRNAAEQIAPEVMTWRPVAKTTAGGKSDSVGSEQDEPDSEELTIDPVVYDGDIGTSLLEAAPEFELPPLSEYTDETFSPAFCDQSCVRPYPRSHLWISAEYLLWGMDGTDLPALVTSSPLGVADSDIGVLGGNSTTLFGGDAFDLDPHSGGRLTIGSWFDPNQSAGWQASYAGFENQSESFRASSDSQPNLARPFLDLESGTEAAFLVAVDGVLTGSVNVTLENQFQIAELLRRQCLSSTSFSRTDWLIGYRYGQFDDRLRIDQSSTFVVPQGPIIAGTNRSLFDLFETDSQFHGAVMGVEHRRRTYHWTISTQAKISLGGNRTEVTIDGQTVTTVPGGGSATIAEGLLAQATNIGTRSDSQFAVMPEFGINLTGHLNPRVRVLVGYNLLYWSGVARSGDQIDRGLSQIPPEPITGSARPRAQFETSGLFLHGLNAGLQMHF
ncbi:BBP7 family outer membrane beta-barrel protein [Neorhodopirellula pilleata]|uniref:BBP7 family outer membrane beta-barrel protein n=1 Tax=Neorhodopirellula pilleata TaxID=2714738 RepID=UPI001E5B19B5|nr:BBP7 family outer membrane beta-barrel protein [Neorhodopirellula pilleata]